MWPNYDVFVENRVSFCKFMGFPYAFRFYRCVFVSVKVEEVKIVVDTTSKYAINCASNAIILTGVSFSSFYPSATASVAVPIRFM